jgi:hypothetical protein
MKRVTSYTWRRGCLTIPPRRISSAFVQASASAYVLCDRVGGFAEHEHLLFIEDSETHAIIAPKHDMHIQEYEAHLAETRPLWEVHNNDQ